MALVLSGQGLAASFGAHPLFENISLAISDGDRLGLIGPNGSGKSTLLRILAGVAQPDDGTVALRKSARLALVPQVVHFPEGATVREILEEATPPGEDREAALAIALGHAGAIDASAEARRLSGGQKRRLAIARA